MRQLGSSVCRKNTQYYLNTVVIKTVSLRLLPGAEAQKSPVILADVLYHCLKSICNCKLFNNLP